jgi:fatty acid desaturase
MEGFGKKLSMIRLIFELAEEMIVLVYVELKLAVTEIKHNIQSVEKGAVMMVVGAALLFFSAVVFIGTSVAILALFLPAWLSALLVALTLCFFGVAFLFTGLGHFKDFTLIPAETLHRVEDISRQYKRVSGRHHAHAHGRRTLSEAAPRSPGQGQLAQ